MDEVIFNIVTEEQPNEVIRVGLPERLDPIFEKIDEIRGLCNKLEQQIIQNNDNTSDRDFAVIEESLTDAASEMKGCQIFLEI